MINSLIAGLISTDGHLAKKKHNITLGLSNKNLMEQIYHLCRNNGIVCTYLNEIHSQKSSNIHYMISISKSKDILDKINRHYDDDRMNTVRVVSTEDKNYLRIISIEELARKDEYVYTLGVKTDHSYTVEGLVVENCFYEPWGADIEIFLEMKKNTGDVNLRARDLFYGLWIPDLFMKHVEEDKDWYLMCPDECPGLVEAYSIEFEELYYSYVERGMYRKKIKARDLWNSILVSQIETGMPYMCYKDAVNTKSNQSNIGTITSSNLCVAPETMILTSTGYHQIKNLKDQEVEVWNGEKFSKTTVRQTGVNQKLIKVNLTENSSLECTPYHKFYLEDGTKIDAGILKSGMKLIRTSLPKLYRNLTVISVEETGRISDTYCFNEPERNMGIFNGILTGNCVEIMLKHDSNEYAVCNIATISLGACVVNGVFDFELLGNLAKIATVNLNKVIDMNYYPTPETKLSNVSHRPIAVGVQGLYDSFIKLRIPFTSPEAKQLNKKIFECIQYHCLSASCELAKEHGPYSSFEGSPSSKGIFQHNMWGLSEENLNYDWKSLRAKVKEYGLRNSLVTALPPTASTANILGNTSSFETITSNIFTRTVMAGNFMIVNKYLVNDLIELDLWDTKLKDEIILANGSVQGIKRIPEHLRELYKTTWETSQKETINMSADRAPFIDHSQSLNIFMANPTAAKLSSAHFHGWKKGLKTGSYYIRGLPISTAEKITVSQEAQQESISCSIDNKDSCVMCEG
jgi:ribonucleotide reductase alpha subunit